MNDRERFELDLEDTGYPRQLRELADPPARLYGIGDPAALKEGVAVIGSRKATPYGIKAATLMAGWAARAGYSVISGGAVGCDQAAHRAALSAHGTTVAVLGCGADVTYPRGAAALLAAVAERGAVVSEAPWGTPPVRWAFARRNRIIAGLSRTLLVVEASLPSGTFGTADHALDAGRSVLVVPGSIFAPECLGSNRLIRQGATPVTDISELAAELRCALGEPSVSVEDPPAGAPLMNDALLSAVRADPQRPDDLARALGLDIVTVVRRLADLEGAELVARYPDGRYGPC